MINLGDVIIFSVARAEKGGYELQWKITIGSPTVNVAKCMIMYGISSFVLIYPQKIDVEKNKIIISPRFNFRFPKILMFWKVDVQGFPTQHKLYQSKMGKLQITDQTHNYFFFSNLAKRWRSLSDLDSHVVILYQFDTS